MKIRKLYGEYFVCGCMWHKAEIYYHQTNEKSVSDESNPIANSHTNKTNVHSLSHSLALSKHTQPRLIRFGSAPFRPILPHHVLAHSHSFGILFLSTDIFRISFICICNIASHTHTCKHTRTHARLWASDYPWCLCVFKGLYHIHHILPSWYILLLVPLKARFDTFKCVCFSLFFSFFKRIAIFPAQKSINSMANISIPFMFELMCMQKICADLLVSLSFSQQHFSHSSHRISPICTWFSTIFT